MKKLSIITVTLGLTVALFGIANAGYMGGAGGCGNCAQQGAQSDPFRKFQADTIDLRQEMMTKRFEIQRENLKASPDAAKIAALQNDITALQTKIHDVRTLSGLPVGKCDGECPPKMGKQGMGGCGKAMGGCNAPCGSPR